MTAVALLLTAAVGGLSVGVSLGIAQLTNPSVAALGPEISAVPAIAIAYGLLSVAGACGMMLGRRWATPLVVGSQGVVGIALLAVYVGAASDLSLLIVATISGGAALCTLANSWMANRA